MFKIIDNKKTIELPEPDKINFPQDFKPKLKKQKINAVIIVEGKTDTEKLKKLFDVDTIETNGAGLNNSTLNLIQMTAKTRPIVLLLDPDGMGEKIRKDIVKNLKTTPFIQCYVNRNDMEKDAKKIGIAETKDSVLIDIFTRIEEQHVFDPLLKTLSLVEYHDLDLNIKARRDRLADQLKISRANNKTMLKTLNMMGLTKERLEKIIQEWD